MAITPIIAATIEAVSGAATNFTANGPFVLYGDNFGLAEYAKLERLGPSGVYLEATNKAGVITLAKYPNMVYVEAPGSYRINKSVTHESASVGYEEV